MSVNPKDQIFEYLDQHPDIGNEELYQEFTEVQPANLRYFKALWKKSKKEEMIQEDSQKKLSEQVQEFRPPPVAAPLGHNQPSSPTLDLLNEVPQNRGDQGQSIPLDLLQLWGREKKTILAMIKEYKETQSQKKTLRNSQTIPVEESFQAYTYTLPLSLHHQFEKLCQRLEMGETKALQLAIQKFIDSYE